MDPLSAEGFTSIGLPELVILLVIALIIFGPRAFGRGPDG
jgi:hypothetical protein